MPEFPIDLPLAADGSLSQTAKPSYVDDQAEVGAPRRRARFTRTLRSFGFSLMLTGAQKDSLENFFHTLTKGGASSFTWQHPHSGVSYTVRFVDPPTIKLQTADAWNAEILLQEV